MIRSKLPDKCRTKRIVGFKKCNDPCVMCSYSTNSNKHTIPHTGEKFTIFGPITCKTCNVIYRLWCQKCNFFLYIGETKRTACERFKEHRSYIPREQVEQATYQHFTKSGHDLSDLRITPIEKVYPKNDPFIRKVREDYWINQYDAIYQGYNKYS